MTREDAIKHIDAMIYNHRIVGGLVLDEYDMEALRMAIKALKHETHTETHECVNGKKSGTLFLNLDDAVKVAVMLGCDWDVARCEFEQKCYLPCAEEYEIGYYDGLQNAIDAIENFANGGDANG